MAKHISHLFSLFFSGLLIILLTLSLAACNEDRKVYIVYMGALPRLNYLAESHHQSLLQEITEESTVEDVLVTSYKRSFNGFAAKLTEKEKQKLEKISVHAVREVDMLVVYGENNPPLMSFFGNKKGIVSIFPSTNYELHTTRSWNFMGLTENVTRIPTAESNMIIGMIDSGIWPNSASFDDKGFGPPPKKWKGVCKGGAKFVCNNKIVGARYYVGDSVLDTIGHGTHTASTAAGNPVKSASFFGYAEGTARGGVPSARIASYLVCHPLLGCPSEALLSAFDDAIADGVDIISISIGSKAPRDFYEDSIAIGAYHAMEKGILTVTSAGNSGPTPSSVSSTAPWMLSVAASTTDRLFIDKVVLGNENILAGRSVNTFDLNGKKFPLVDQQCKQCKQKVGLAGKILVSTADHDAVTALKEGAAGAIIKNIQNTNESAIAFFPKSNLNQDDYNILLAYMNSTKNPVGSILKTEVVTDSTAPVVQHFSSRGPNLIVHDILKPDLTAPGVDVLAAFSSVAPLTPYDKVPRHANYSIMSGTSMSCPHAAGAAAYVKTFHPDWSPSAIKSALMTSAWPMKLSSNPDGEFAYGSGHIDPIKATDPGLVYESSTEDYTEMLCTIYSPEQVHLVTGNSTSCSTKGDKKAPGRNINYPSITAQAGAKKPFRNSYHRTVTNVGQTNSTYNVQIPTKLKFAMEVIPSVLSFHSVGEKLSYNVTVSGPGLGEAKMLSESLVWSDGIHNVRTPIVLWLDTDL